MSERPDTSDAALPPAATPLTRAVLEIDSYAATMGWDLPARLFALVDTARLRPEDAIAAIEHQIGS